MYVRICLLIISLFVLHARSFGQDSVGIQYVVDTIAAPNCYQSGDGAILLDNVSIPGTIDRYEWSDGSDLEDLIFVNGGYYQLTIYNTDGDSFQTEEFFIPEPDTLVISSFISPPTAYDKNNGFIDLMINGGTAPYELTMIFNQDTIMEMVDTLYSLEQLDTGRYIFTVLDARGCTDTAIYNITRAQPCEMLVVALVDPAECSGSPTGKIELIVDRAVEPYTIDWADRTDNRTTLFNLDAGVYHFAISDRRRCTAVDSIEIVYEDQIPPSVLTINRMVRYLDDEGKVEVLPRDVLIGAKDECHNNLTYKFDKSTFDCEDVGINELIFQVIDGVGNATTVPIELEIRDTHSVELIYQDTVYTALCNGIAQYQKPQVFGSCATLSDGGIVKMTNREITASGTYVDRYYYVISPGDTLKAEVTVIVSDNRVRSFLIVEEPICNTGNDGSLAVALRNSMAPVSYMWEDGSTEDFIFGIRNKQEYRVTVKEGNGCIFELSAIIEGPDSLVVELDKVVEKENSIDVIPIVMGGHQPLQYAWYSDGGVISDSRNLLDVPDGKRYELIVTDARGCVSSPLIVDRLMSSAASSLTQTVELFPNPIIGQSLYIRFLEDFPLYSGIRVFNSRQQMILEFRPEHAEITLNVKNYPPGLYFIQFIRSDGQWLTKKFIRS